jgi:hypothetical protein
MPKKKLTKKENEARLKRYAEASMPEWQKQELIDLMTKKKPEQIAPTTAKNDVALHMETFPSLIIDKYTELFKDLLPILRKYRVMDLKISIYKKWIDGEDLMSGTANKV